MVRSRWILVLAVLLLTQWSAAYSHCHALAAGSLESFAGDICSVNGHGGPFGDHEPGKQKGFVDQDCPACHQLPVLQAADPPSASVSLIWFTVEMEPTVTAGTLPPARAPPYESHAPPTV
jgi:hypothetical protein